MRVNIKKRNEIRVIGRKRDKKLDSVSNQTADKLKIIRDDRE